MFNEHTVQNWENLYSMRRPMQPKEDNEQQKVAQSLGHHFYFEPSELPIKVERVSRMTRDGNQLHLVFPTVYRTASTAYVQNWESCVRLPFRGLWLSLGTCPPPHSCKAPAPEASVTSQTWPSFLPSCKAGSQHHCSSFTDRATESFFYCYQTKVNQ